MVETLELEKHIEHPIYESDYKYVIKDGKLLWEVAQKLTEDPDFTNSRVSIGVGNNPHFYIDGEQGLYFKLSSSLVFYGGLGKEKIQELEPLVKKHISRELKLIGRSKGDSNLFWKTLVIADGKKMKQFLGSTTTTLLINLMI